MELGLTEHIYQFLMRKKGTVPHFTYRMQPSFHKTNSSLITRKVKAGTSGVGNCLFTNWHGRYIPED